MTAAARFKSPIPAGPPWTRWFPAAVAGTPSDWELRRFEAVDAAGNPIGPSMVSISPAGTVRIFKNEQRALWAADELNRAEGL